MMKHDTRPTQAFAEFASTLTLDDVPAATVNLTKRIILDTLGCALAATTLGDGCRETIDVMRRLGGSPESTILGSSAKIPAPHAAFANGALVHALNYDPIGIETGHMGVVCLSAPLAAAEAAGGVSGREFLLSSIVACEICARVNAAIARTRRQPSERFLSGQLLSYFGATAGAGRAFGLTPVQMHSALGLALMQMAGSRQIVLQGDPSAKAIYGAFPNQAAITSALLAKAGLRADCDVIGAPAGLYPMIYQGEYDAGTLTEGLGTLFLLNEVEFKPWPASNKVNIFVEAAIEIANSGLSTTDISAIEILAHEKFRPWCEPIEKRQRPTNAAAAANSIPFCVAKALSRGDLVLDDLVSDGLKDPVATGLASQTICRLNSEEQVPTLVVTCRDGRRMKATVQAPLGSPARPISETMLRKKFIGCCSHSTVPLGEAQAKEIAASIYDLQELDDIGHLMLLLQPPAGP
jgi:2-methylcitrate dehydratase PrpD